VDGIVDPSNRRVINRYLTNLEENFRKGYGLILYGEPGVGKTSIAALIAKEARSWKKTVFFTMIWELRECLRARVMFDDSTSILDRCREVDLLVLDGFVEDDIDEKLVNARMLEQLITYRGQRNKLTVVTTRIDRERLQTGKGLRHFKAGTESYLYLYKIVGGNLRTSRKEEMRAAIKGEGD